MTQQGESRLEQGTIATIQVLKLKLDIGRATNGEQEQR